MALLPPASVPHRLTGRTGNLIPDGLRPVQGELRRRFRGDPDVIQCRGHDGGVMHDDIPVALSDAARRLLDGRNFATVATVGPGGQPHSSVVWADRDGDTVVFSLTADKQKARNMAREPHFQNSIGVPDYFNGQIADPTYSTSS